MKEYDQEPFEVFALRYATHERRRVDNFLGGDPHDGPMPLDYYVWVARNAQATYVIDTGFDADTAKRRGRTLLRDPMAALRMLDVEPNVITDVIITHLHYDHVGNFAHFPNARFHLQDVEMAYATGRHMGHPRLRHPFDVEHVVGMVHCVYQDRVCFHDGDTELLPTLSLHLIGGHTPGLQCVRIWTARGWVVLASDASHHYAHFETGRAFPNVVRVDQMLEGHLRLKALASSPQHVVPGHDPLVMARYPAPSAQLQGIGVRLDVPPVPEGAGQDSSQPGY